VRVNPAAILQEPLAHEQTSSVRNSAADPSGRAQAPESAGQGRSDRPVLPAEVLERVRARDERALATFFDAYFDRVFGLVLRLLGDREAAEDVTQDVFVKIHRAADRIDPARDPGPWVTTIAYNTCRDLWRSGGHRMRRRSTSIEADPVVAGKLTPGTNDPERDALRAERMRRVQEAIGRLPEPLRTAVVLFEYEGMSHQEIADLVGIQHAAARKRYSRALEALGKLLKDVVE